MNRVPSQGKPHVSAITALWLCVIAQKHALTWGSIAQPRGQTARNAVTSAAISAGSGA